MKKLMVMLLASMMCACSGVTDKSVTLVESTGKVNQAFSGTCGCGGACFYDIPSCVPGQQESSGGCVSQSSTNDGTLTATNCSGTVATISTDTYACVLVGLSGGYSPGTITSTMSLYASQYSTYVFWTYLGYDPFNGLEYSPSASVECVPYTAFSTHHTDSFMSSSTYMTVNPGKTVTQQLVSASDTACFLDYTTGPLGQWNAPANTTFGLEQNSGYWKLFSNENYTGSEQVFGAACLGFITQPVITYYTADSRTTDQVNLPAPSVALCALYSYTGVTGGEGLSSPISGLGSDEPAYIQISSNYTSNQRVLDAFAGSVNGTPQHVAATAICVGY
jgi:hypothetical protein